MGGIIPHIWGMDIRRTILDEIERFSAATGLAETSIGSKAVKDSRFVDRLRAGHGVSINSIEKLRQYLKDEGALRQRAIASRGSPAIQTPDTPQPSKAL
jgi:hypothetical protein